MIAIANRRFFYFVGVLILMATSGCATAFVRSESTVDPKHVYPATVFDARFFWESGIKGKNLFASANAEDQMGLFARFAYGTGAVIDLPFSIAVDTVLLPLDLFKAQPAATNSFVSDRTSHTRITDCGNNLPPVGTEFGEPYATNVVVIWKLKHYVVGWVTSSQAGEQAQFLNEPNDDYRWKVDGFVMEIVEPPKYAGQIIGAHFDGSGTTDPYSFYKMGVRYKEDVPKSAIGHMKPSMCR
jgi:uncharacterized protein YceK